MKRLIALCALLTLATSAHAAVDFEKQVLPIFEAHCLKCHGEEKPQARLALHSAEGIKAKLADDDHLLVAGDPDKSELYARLVLPADNKKRMPKGADPLSQEQLDLIAAWIKEGAPFTVVEAEPAEAKSKTQPASSETKPLEPLPLPEVPAPSQEAVDRLIAAGAQVMPLFADSPLLDVSFGLSVQPPTDDTLKLLADLAPQVISLNLKNAKASDAGWAVLAELENLTILNVQGSSFSDAAAQHLKGLERLESLNLYGTKVTDAALEPLKGLKRLQKLYLWQTEVTYDGAAALGKEIPGHEWNLGWDHPVVARKRLESQKAEFAELLKKAEAETNRLKGELKVAEEAQTTAAERLKQAESELAKLNGTPATDPPPADAPAE